MKRSLSDMKREKPREPFILTVNPSQVDDDDPASVDVEFANPKALHWTKLAALDELPPAQAIESLIEDPVQYAAFRDDPAIDGEALEWVMSQWRAHFGLGGPGESGGSTGS